MAKNETSSDDIKTGLADCYGWAASEWKRKSKTKLKNAGGHDVKRVFENATQGVTVVVYGDDGDDFGSFNEAGTMLFRARDLDEDEAEEMDGEGPAVFLMFAAETFWNRNHYIPDNHISFFLSDHYGVDCAGQGFDEMSENQFIVAGKTAAEVSSYLESLGMRHEPDMDRAGRWDEGG